MKTKLRALRRKIEEFEWLPLVALVIGALIALAPVWGKSRPVVAKARTEVALLDFANIGPTPLAVQVVDVRGAGPDLSPPPWPGAIQVPFEKVVTVRDGLPNQLRELSELGLVFEGLDPAVPTLVVGSGKKPELYMDVARVAYALEALGFRDLRFLKGGIETVSEADRARLNVQLLKLGKKIAVPASAPATLGLLPEVRRMSMAKQAAPGILDVRTAEQYLGATKKEVVARFGHIPRARDFPFPLYFEKKGEDNFEWRSPGELRKQLISLGFVPGGTVFSTCNTGREANLGYLMLRLAGFERARLYSGSTAEWARNPKNPMVTYRWE